LVNTDQHYLLIQIVRACVEKNKQAGLFTGVMAHVEEAGISKLLVLGQELIECGYNCRSTGKSTNSAQVYKSNLN